MDKLLIVIDMQRDFVTGVLGSDAAQGIVAPVAQKISEYRRGGQRVLYTADTHTQAEYDGKHSLESVRIPRHCVRGEEGWKIVPGLSPAPGEILVEKPSFCSLGLTNVIGPLAPNIKIVLCGVCTDICVVSNALALRAAYPANKITVLQDCCAGTSEENHKAALAVMRSCLIDVE